MYVITRNRDEDVVGHPFQVEDIIGTTKKTEKRK